LNEKRSRKRKGWFSTSAFSKIDIAVRTNTVAEWDGLSIQRKHELAAYVNAKSLMEQWEKETEKKPKKGL